MSMCLALCTLSDENITKVLEDPPLIWKVIAPDDPQAYDTARNGPQRTGLLARLFGKKQAPPPGAVELTLADNEVAYTDVDKAWHGIHYMLTQRVWDGDGPLAFLLSGGSEVGDIDVGYGPARTYTAAQVHNINAALTMIDEAYLRARLNPSEMMKLGIYPEIWDRDPAQDDTFSYCADNFKTLKSFVADAAKRNLGLVV